MVRSHPLCPLSYGRGVLGVAFAVILAFVLFLGFESYIRASEGASREAVAVSQLARVSRLLPAAEGEELRGDLGCYARAVISDEWPLMREGRESDVVLGWLEQLETTIDEMPVDDAVSEVALGHWLEEMAVRREGGGRGLPNPRRPSPGRSGRCWCLARSSPSHTSSSLPTGASAGGPRPPWLDRSPPSSSPACGHQLSR